MALVRRSRRRPAGRQTKALHEKGVIRRRVNQSTRPVAAGGANESVRGEREEDYTITPYLRAILCLQVRQHCTKRAQHLGPHGRSLLEQVRDLAVGCLNEAEIGTEDLQIR